MMFDEDRPRKGGGSWPIVLSVIVVFFLLGAMVMLVILADRAGMNIVPPAIITQEPTIPDPAQDTPAVASTVTPQPTPTVTPAATPSPSATPAATATPQAILPTAVPGAQLPVDITGNPFVNIAKDSASSVVGVSNRIRWVNQNGVLDDVVQGGGSGVILSEDGYIITNAHVVDKADSISVTLTAGKEIEATLVGIDTVTDIAVLRIDEQGLVPLKRGDSSAVQVGEFVVAIGNPLSDELFGTVTMGIVSATNRVLEIDSRMVELIQTDAAINPGNSGGALLNIRGELIGINTLKFSTYYGGTYPVEGLGFAIPINDAIPIAEELIAKGKIDRPVLGVSIETLTPYRAEYYKVPVGVLIKEVYSGSPADKAGLKPADVIVAANGKRIQEIAELSAALNQQTFDSTIRITVYREGQEITLPVKLTRFELPQD